MKLTLVALLVFTVGVNANVTAQHVTLNKTISIKGIFEEIRKQTNYRLIYEEGRIDISERISVNFSNTSLRDVLDKVFQGKELSYKIYDGTVIVKKAEPVGIPSIATKRQELVRGQVKNETGAPLPGVTVSVVGKTRTVASDGEGRYEIAVQQGDSIRFSFMGYQEKTLVVNASIINVQLQIAVGEDLDEVVVVGFGTQKKASVVGAITTISSKELRIPTSTLSNAFAGRLAGVVAVQRGGEPGADGANFWIRGISTFAGPTSPLVFIDGVESSTSDLNALAPEVIDGFSVLKDATATALYGARGANGVMLVTTRSGANMEKARINFRLENTFTQPTKMIEMADGVDYINVFNEAILNRNPTASPRFSQDQIDGVINRLDPMAYPNVDWQDYLFRDFASTQIGNLNITGGGQRANYFVSASLNNDNGMLKKDPLNTFDNNIKQKRYSFMGNIGVNLTSTTKVTLRVNSRILGYSGSSSSTATLYRDIFEAPPVLFAPVLPALNGEDHILFGNSNGGPVPSGQGNNIYRNPYATMVSGYSNRDESTTISSLEGVQDLKFIAPGLSVKGLVSFKNWSSTNIVRSFSPYYYAVTSFTTDPSGEYNYNFESVTRGTDALTTTTSTTGDRMVNIQANIDYARTFGVHDVSAMIVYLQRDYNTNNPQNDFYATLPTRNQGLAGRLTYGYDSRYLFEANFGYNGSENFADGSRFGFFPSFAAGYLISNEKFFKPLKAVVTSLKIRGSLGIVGNSFTDPRFPYLTFVNLSGRGYTFGNDFQTSGTGATITKYGTPNAQWEEGTKTNIGLDLSLFNRFNLTTDFFTETREGIFMQRQVVPAEAGIIGNLPFGNLGKVKNSGFDATLDYSNFWGNDIVLNLRGTFTFAKNELLARDEPNLQYEYLSDIGHPLNRNKGLVAIGLFESEADIASSPEQTYSPNLRPGDIKYADLNGDGRIDDLDIAQMGSPTVPQIVYGFGGSLQIKKFDFSVFFQGVAKTSLLMNNIHPFNSDQTSLLNFIAQDHWSESNPNPSAEYPRLINNINDHNNFRTSTYWLRDGSFLRLKNAEFGYTYKMARFYLSGQNLLTFSKFKHWDPELGGGNGLTYPNLRVATLGVQLVF